MLIPDDPAPAFAVGSHFGTQVRRTWDTDTSRHETKGRGMRVALIHPPQLFSKTQVTAGVVPP